MDPIVCQSVHLLVSLSIHPLCLHVIQSTGNTRAGINKIRQFSMLIVNPKLAPMPVYLCVSVPIYHSACACISSIACLFISAYLFLDPIVCKSLHRCICLFLCQPIHTSIMFVCLFANLDGMIKIRHNLLVCLCIFVYLWLFCSSLHLLTHLFVHQCVSIHGSNCMSVFTSVHLFVSLSIHPLCLHVIKSTVNTRAGINKIRHFSMLIVNPKLAPMPVYLCVSLTVYPSVCPGIS